MKDYSKGKIYTIRCLTNDALIYVGSTIQSLCERLVSHKRDGRNEKTKHTLLYSTINEDWDNWKIELHQLYPCSCIEELRAKEGEIIRLISTLNKNIAGRTRKEWANNNKDKVAKYKAEYSKKNKEDPIRKEKQRLKGQEYYQKKKLNKNIVL